MSENKKNSGGLGPLIATVLVGAAAVAAVVVLIVMVSNAQSRESGQSGGALGSDATITFKPTQELVDEFNDNAHDLVAGNYEILQLFLLEGVPHEDEPYGNEPEDGYYTAKSSKYPTYAELEKFVRSVLVAEEAQRILGDIDGNGRRIYVPREGYNGALGIVADFTPDTSYGKSWESTRIQFVPVSETECALTVFLGADEETDLSALPEDMKLETSMVKGTDGWRLTRLAY